MGWLRRRLDRGRSDAAATARCASCARGSRDDCRAACNACSACDDRGAAAVEFGLVLIPLMVVVMGIISFGIVFTQKQSLSNASRDAARAGVVIYQTPIYCRDLISQAKATAETIGMASSAVSVKVWRNYSVSGSTESGTALCEQVNNGSITGTMSGTTTADRPCYGATESGGTSQLTVITKHSASIELVVTSFEPTITGKGTFRCEYTT